MNPKPNASSMPNRLRKSHVGAAFMGGAFISLLSVWGCSAPAPKGQVVATVNGQEITAQDLAAESRAGNQGQDATNPSLLQAVIGRVLLVQEARAKKLDQYPGFPSDVARLQQELLAQKLLQSVVMPPDKPTQADLDKFMAAHPYSFAQRQAINVDEVRFQPAAGMTQPEGADSIDALVSRLHNLNATVERQKRTIDTAAIAPQLAEKLVNLPPDQVLYIQGQPTIAVAVLSKTPAQTTADQNNAMATNLMMQEATHSQIDSEVGSLLHKAHIVYQPGYEPPAPARAASNAAKH